MSNVSQMSDDELKQEINELYENARRMRKDCTVKNLIEMSGTSPHLAEVVNEVVVRFMRG